MNRTDIISATRTMLAEHGLSDYRVRVSAKMTKTFGTCNYSKREITISGPLAAVNSDDEVRNTIAHEVAHAIAGYTAGHGPKWKAACALTGATPKACYSTATVTPVAQRYKGTCRACGVVVAQRDRAPKPHAMHHHKANRCDVRGASVEARRIVWTDTRATPAPVPAAPVVHVPAAVRVPVAARTVATPAAPTAGTMTCTGTCGETRPVTKFPTTKNGARGTECRSCRDARRAAARR